MWYVVEKLKNGYIGFCKVGVFYGRTRMEVITLMLNETTKQFSRRS